MKDTFLQAIRDEYPNENITRLVFADWCLENEPNLESKLRRHFPFASDLQFPINYGNGDLNTGSGDGMAYGIGDEEGMGHGEFGDGFGDESGDGKWHGFKFGNNDGFGFGDGSGYEFRHKHLLPKMPKLFTNQLVFLPHGFVFCGFIQEHIQPYQFKITNAKLITYAGNNSWENIANNVNRKKVVFLNYDTITIGPQFFHSIDWEGNLP